MQAIRSRMTLESADSTGHQVAGRREQKIRRRMVRYSLISVNIVLVIAIAWFVMAGQSAPGQQVSAIGSNAAADELANPLDQLSSADIAVNVARMSGLPEGVAVVNQADSMSTEMALAPASTSIVAKPQVVATALKSKNDIITYVAVAGDTVTSIAAKFNVTSDSVRWSNGISSNNVNVGQTLYIPPEPGIVYTVKAGDTAESLANKYKANVGQIIAYNDAEISGLKVGERIVIPNGQQPAPPAPVRSVASAGFAWGTTAIYGFNGYTYGYCTWYVAGKIAVPANWGNANTWDDRAPLTGWVVSPVPRAGAIGQTDRGSEGHVGIVHEVSPDGSMIKFSDMNGLAGWGRVGHSDWVSASKFESYIYQ